MFAGSCIGVVCLVIALEFLKRLSKENDLRLMRKFHSRYDIMESVIQSTTEPGDIGNGESSKDLTSVREQPIPQHRGISSRPTLPQQAVRAALHVLQVALAYFIMLLAMSYNGYLIICIFIGAYTGYFIFGWETVSRG